MVRDTIGVSIDLYERRGEGGGGETKEKSITNKTVLRHINWNNMDTHHINKRNLIISYNESMALLALLPLVCSDIYNMCKSFIGYIQYSQSPCKSVAITVRCAVCVLCII